MSDHSNTQSTNLADAVRDLRTEMSRQQDIAERIHYWIRDLTREIDAVRVDIRVLTNAMSGKQQSSSD